MRALDRKARAIDLAARAIAVRIAAAPLLRARSLPGVLASITPSKSSPLPRDEAERAIAIAESIVSRARVLPDTCLYRSLARYAALRRAGHAARFVMAVANSEPEIEGHAWVEIDGIPVGETLDPGLTITYSFPPQPPRAAPS